MEEQLEQMYMRSQVGLARRRFAAAVLARRAGWPAGRIGIAIGGRGRAVVGAMGRGEISMANGSMVRRRFRRGRVDRAGRPAAGPPPRDGRDWRRRRRMKWGHRRMVGRRREEGPPPRSRFERGGANRVS